ncbi:TATA-binding protein-associated factor 2N-like [Panicum virgatum]|uniref:TATA-binding protein-associated factor 2N-like n=1 Tax=Panicum virgatum TaxID=38727 RepID=UPI0019D602F0|nr:TATA-binding protein-associated factor 2N-like [Panicum virgatum]
MTGPTDPEPTLRELGAGLLNLGAKMDRMLGQITTINSRLDSHDRRITCTEKFQSGDDDGLPKDQLRQPWRSTSLGGLGGSGFSGPGGAGGGDYRRGLGGDGGSDYRRGGEYNNDRGGGYGGGAYYDGRGGSYGGGGGYPGHGGG